MCEKLTPYQLDVFHGKICPYCKSGTKMMSELQVYGKTYSNRVIIACKNYPRCDSYVGTHDNGIPLGRLAKQSLRVAKKEAHKHFDKIWKRGFVKRGELYEWLSDYLGIPRDYTHIGMFSLKTCKDVKVWSQALYERLKNGQVDIETVKSEFTEQ